MILWCWSTAQRIRRGRSCCRYRFAQSGGIDRNKRGMAPFAATHTIVSTIPSSNGVATALLLSSHS
jgi:hypothetical protein